MKETNLYAEQFLEKNKTNLKPRSNALNWNSTDPNEVKIFIGLIVLMGIVYKPRLHMCWSTDSLFSIYSEVMGRDRFFVGHR